jgi:DNA repair exonuclease SbcCD ATPase subunit
MCGFTARDIDLSIENRISYFASSRGEILGKDKNASSMREMLLINQNRNQKTTIIMKLPRFYIITFLVLLLALGSKGWVPQAHRIATTKAIAVASPTFAHKRDIEEIASELEELGDEIKKPVLQDAHGMNQYQESLPHHLRLEIHDLKKSLHATQETLKTIQKTLEEYSVVWETAELELKREKEDREEEHESVRRLLGSAIKLMGRRVKNGFRRLLFLKIKD